MGSYFGIQAEALVATHRPADSSQIVVTTPGRALRLLSANELAVGGLTLVAVDSVDRLVAAGTADDALRVLALVPHHPQVCDVGAW